jgi:hypothetical protein
VIENLEDRQSYRGYRLRRASAHRNRSVSDPEQSQFRMSFDSGSRTTSLVDPASKIAQQIWGIPLPIVATSNRLSFRLIST